ncbi:MAG TPA: hypothetical protein VES67_05230 [Vicinamibacterales bacterium]|nr:hypothetical protein [Vicinamibacterales bacterium]
MKVARANLDRTDGKRSKEWLHEIKLPKKSATLELLMKHFRLLVDIVEIDTTEARLAKLDAARAKNAARKRKQ